MGAVNSEYAFGPYVITHVTLLGSSGLFLLLGALAVLHAYCTGRVALWHLRFFGIVALSLCGLITLDLAVVQGMDVVPTAATAAICLVAWACLTPFVVVFLGGNAESVLWLKSETGTSGARRRRAETAIVQGPRAHSEQEVQRFTPAVSMENFRVDHSIAIASAPSGIDGLRGPGATRRSAANSNGSSSSTCPSPLAAAAAAASYSSTPNSPSAAAIMLAKAEIEEKRRQKDLQEQHQQQQQQQQYQHEPISENETPSISESSSIAVSGAAAAISVPMENNTTGGSSSSNNHHNGGGRTDLRHSGADAIQLLTEMSRPMMIAHQQTSDAKNNDDRNCHRATFVPSIITNNDDDQEQQQMKNVDSKQKQQEQQSQSDWVRRNFQGASDSNSIVRGFFRIFLFDVKRHYFLFILWIVFALASIAATHTVLYGICVLNKPTGIETWIMRKSMSQFCPAGDKPCFIYPLLGDTCSTMVIASHLRIEDDSQIPSTVTATVCDMGETNVTMQCSTVSGIIRNNDNIREDRRYIANVYLQGLRCGGRHSVFVTFFPAATAAAAVGSSKTKSFVSDTICFNALPGRATDPDTLQNKVAELSFIEGGDYVVKGRSKKPGKGKTLLVQAMKEAPDAAFFALVGDIAYENNIRRCYRRMDEMLHEVFDVLKRPSDGCLLPLDFFNGNHCSGGYLFQGEETLRTPAGREAASSFYFQYFPKLSFQDSTSQASGRAVQPENGTKASSQQQAIQAAPSDLIGDHTRTFSVQLIGSNSSLVVADSGHWSPLSVQAPLLRDALKRLRGLGKSAMVGYHVPAWPSTREPSAGPSLGTSGGHSAAVLDSFGPVLADFDDVITIAFEHHDHNYKRTHRIHALNGSVVVEKDFGNAMVAERRRGRGVVFNGDGALGASDEAPLNLASPPLKVGFSGNYVTVGRLYVNGSLAVKAIGSAGEEIDKFTVL